VTVSPSPCTGNRKSHSFIYSFCTLRSAT
jgi:hypothetical protein